jgi:hypothetical protein
MRALNTGAASSSRIGVTSGGFSALDAEIQINTSGTINLDADQMSVNNQPGQTVTKTVRDSAGTGTCTLIFTLGWLTGGTC